MMMMIHCFQLVMMEMLAENMYCKFSRTRKNVSVFDLVDSTSPGGVSWRDSATLNRSLETQLNSTPVKTHRSKPQAGRHTQQ
jgi:hypothetical protein